ncbi:MAG: L,D-transpeptidase [Burkholderiaceae bacterium]|nr:L,D-transpeptidase [Burkholderiaceae bacterium]
MRSLVRTCGLAALLWALAGLAAAADDVPPQWREKFALEVDRRLDVPAQAQQRYLALLDAALADAGLADLPMQTLVLVDRSVQVQAAFVVLRTPEKGWFWLGASPVSTGRVGSFDHFRTPVGVFAHSLDNPDFRSEGTYNQNHIRGYGERGMRVFDFGWTQAERGWGAGGQSTMRLQMHATDPDTLEPRLGRPESKGCIRIAATLNVFLDRYGVLDADYEQALARGRSLWVMRADRTPVPWPGRYLVIVDSQATERPAWAPLPGAKQAAPGASAAGPVAPAATATTGPGGAGVC